MNHINLLFLIAFGSLGFAADHGAGNTENTFHNIFSPLGKDAFIECLSVPIDENTSKGVSVEDDGNGNLSIIKRIRRETHTSTEIFPVEKVINFRTGSPVKYISPDLTVAKTVEFKVDFTLPPSKKSNASLIITTKKLVRNQTEISTEKIKLKCHPVVR